MFAVTMGINRIIFGKYGEKMNLVKYMTASGMLCVICYLMASLSSNPVIGLIGCVLCGFSVAIMWPGTISISSKKFPKGGTAMFGLLAMAGDLGGSIGPSAVGMISQKANDNLQQGLFFGGIFLILLIVFLIILKLMKDKK